MPQSTAAVNTFRRETAPYFSYREQCILRQWMDRYWISFLTPAETKTLLVIISRTVAWGKLWETIPLRHFIEGSALRPREQPEDGLFTARAFRGTGMSKNTVKGALRALEADGFIRTKPHRDTTRYAVNWHDMGGANDPVLRRFDLDAEGAELQAEIAAIRRRIRAEGGSEIDPLSKLLHHSLRSLSETAIAVSSSAPGAQHSGETTPQEDQMADVPMPSRRERNRPAAAAPQAPADWRQMEKRVAGRAENDEASKPVLQAAKALARSTADVVTDLPLLEGTRTAKLRTGRETVDKTYTLWADAVVRANGPRSPKAPGVKIAARIKVMLGLSTPDPRVRWGDVAAWVAENYGEAVALAVPFMLKTPEKRANILHNAPSLTLLLAFPEHFAVAYTALFHGEGYTPAALTMAQGAQTEHRRWMNRRLEARAVSHENLSGANRTTDELMDAAVEAAKVDPEFERLLIERRNMQEIAKATPGDGAAQVKRAAENIQRERTRQRIRDSAAEREELAKAMGLPVYSENPDDYYNEE